MKRILSIAATAALALSLGAIAGTSANAVNCASFNKGTATAFHTAGADGAGLYKIAGQCHMQG